MYMFWGFPTLNYSLYSEAWNANFLWTDLKHQAQFNWHKRVATNISTYWKYSSLGLRHLGSVELFVNSGWLKFVVTAVTDSVSSPSASLLSTNEAYSCSTVVPFCQHVPLVKLPFIAEQRSMKSDRLTLTRHTGVRIEVIIILIHNRYINYLNDTFGNL